MKENKQMIAGCELSEKQVRSLRAIVLLPLIIGLAVFGSCTVFCIVAR